MKKDIETKREREKERVSRMSFRCPVTAMRHVIETKKEKRKLEAAS